MAIQRNLDRDHIVARESYDQFIEDLCLNIPACRDDDVAVESIIIDYLRQIEIEASLGAKHALFCNGRCS